MGEARRVRATARKRGEPVPLPVRPTGGVQVDLWLPTDLVKRLDAQRGDATRRAYILATITRSLETWPERATRLVAPATPAQTSAIVYQGRR